MAEKVKKLNVSREEGFLYYLKNSPLEVWRSPMKRPGPKGQAELVATTGVKREKNFLYYLDKQGDLARSPQQRGGSRRKG